MAVRRGLVDGGWPVPRGLAVADQLFVIGLVEPQRRVLLQRDVFAADAVEDDHQLGQVVVGADQVADEEGDEGDGGQDSAMLNVRTYRESERRG